MRSTFRILLTFCVLLLAGTCGLSAQSKNPQDLAPGKLLVARPQGTDSLFAKSVILLVRYDHTGALGLMINHRTKMPISRALSGLEGAKGHSDPIFLGGPVQLRTVFALARADRKPEGATAVLGDIYFISARTDLEKALGRESNPGDIRVYVGYCGWGPQQLDTEVLRGSWYIFGQSEDLAFDAKPATLWSRLITKAKEQFVRLRNSRAWHRGSASPR